MNLFKNEKEVIQEIHDSFDNAQEELLQEANAIIGQYDTERVTKADRLEKLGFKKSLTVVENLKKKNVLLNSKKDADLVNYYKSTYPFLKFLKEEQMEAICKKYNLVFAPVERYKKDVPEKNVAEIEGAQVLRVEDSPKNKVSTRFTLDSFYWKSNFKLKRLGLNNIIEGEKILWTTLVESRIEKEYPEFRGDFHVDNIEILEEKRGGLFIAAPKSHFDLKGLKNKKSGFFNISITEVKDPIVFRYVRGGIQVLSKWGLEAYDESLQNEILN